MKNVQVVWFKRDLRVEDHEPLIEALKHGPVIPLYIIEPDLWAQPDLSSRHYDFITECLHDLNERLKKLGQPLIIRVGEAVDVLNELQSQTQFETLWSHQETWNGWTYERDLAVKRWAQDKGIAWYEPSQFGVIRRIQNRNGWAARWTKKMNGDILPPPARLEPIDIKSQNIPTKEKLNITPDPCPQRQTGTREQALKDLNAFLYERGEGYQKEMSSPVTAFTSCSRLSAHLSFGTISMREVYQIAAIRTREIANLPRSETGKWPGAMRAFNGRLRWHCHFIQKLEDDPRFEFENMHSAYDGLREPDFDDAKFEAWKAGMTGYPLIDASMRALNATGWLNFRMRAMLVSFASYHLWLHWRKPSLHLAGYFMDYEPGIHYCQHQMQSGTTGINAIRIYNPLKQGMDQDPDGVFIKQWIPELRDVPSDFIHKVEHLHDLAPDYPKMIVHEKEARKAAADKIYGIRKSKTHREEADEIVDKHGSRKSGMDQGFRKRNGKGVITLREAKQGELPL
ncbi:MAG: FAD-binding domain-containing protein [Pseudomonadota bacterium]